MPTTGSYLIPIDPLDVADHAMRPTLDGLVQKLVSAYQMAQTSANLVLKTGASPALAISPHHQNLGATHAKVFTSQGNMGVASCLLKDLSQVCDCVLTLSQESLLRLAVALDLGHAQASLPVGIWEDFCSSLKLLNSACCADQPSPHNLMGEVQALIPALARLSGQIDNEMMTLQAQLTQLSITAIPAQMMHLASIEAFNHKVHEVLTTAQSIVNVMSAWQDSLGVLMASPPSTRPAHFYEQQIQAGIDYWQVMQTALNHYLTPHIERKI